MPNDTHDTTPLLNDYLKGDAALARELERSPRTIARWRKVGEGPAITRIGRQVFYHRADVKAWLAEMRVERD